MSLEIQDADLPNLKNQLNCNAQTLDPIKIDFGDHSMQKGYTKGKNRYGSYSKNKQIERPPIRSRRGSKA